MVVVVRTYTVWAAVTAMIMAFFPVKKLRRNGKHLLFVAILLVGVVAVYNEISAAKAGSSENSMNPNANRWLRAILNERMRGEHQPDSSGDSNAWMSSYNPQTWKPEYKGQANLHAFEDWCGSSTADLRKNPHYPLYPHSRTTVQKLAITPQWTNYGLRIFGYLHPYTDGDYVFALSSDDNSELWLSTDDSPLNLQLLAWVGKTGTEWTAPGEFEKYASQTSRPVWLSAQRRYFFEVIYKQNDKGLDHVEVAWQLLDQGLSFMVIGPRHISLYVNESDLLVNDVSHIPQTAASHQLSPTKHLNAAADILTEDPRDTFYKVNLINSNFLNNVLPDCSYSPSYTIKDYPLTRYQGLQFVHLSYIYPNDYTRLTHMEKENSCFYADSPLKMRRALSRYMKLDYPGTQDRGNAGREDIRYKWKKSSLDEGFDKKAYDREMDARLHQRDNNLFPDYGDDYDDYIQNRRRKLFSLDIQETRNTLVNSSDIRVHMEELGGMQPQPEKMVPSQAPQKQMTQNQTRVNKIKQDGPVRKVQQLKSKKRPRLAQKQKVTPARPGQDDPALQTDKEPYKPKQLLPKQRKIQRSHKINQRFKDSQLQKQEMDPPTERPAVTKQRWFVTREKEIQAVKHFITPNKDINHRLVRSNQGDIDARQSPRDTENKENMPPQQDLENSIYRKVKPRDKMHPMWPDTLEWNQGLKDSYLQNKAEGKKDTRKEDRDFMWGPGEDYEVPEDDDERRPAVVFDPEVRWNQTFQVNHLDLQAQRSDEIDLRCPISGNLLLHSSDALPVVEAFMDHLNKKHYGQFTLVRVVNTVKRVDWAKGGRYLLELELKDKNGQLLRLSHYIYVLIHNRIHQDGLDIGFEQLKPQPLLCNPVGFRWNPGATVHIIVPVKNQARWVQQLITDMEELFRETRDTNFNLIISDFSSTDMDVRKSLQKSSIPRYQYVKLSGNFERASGLQAGIDQINDDHSIVFLCDLHLHFPSSIIDSIRKHCVEGHMAFAPIVMRLDCGSTPSEARGFWEVNGFGLLGIYKSDLDKVGGMNTKEFKESWGGEDWELLDRILQAGLEVDRIYLRNFFHHYHSKRGMWNRRMSTGFK